MRQTGVETDRYLLLREEVLWWGVVGLMVSRQGHLGGGQVHLVSGQNGRVVSSPQVVVALGGGAGVLHLTGLDPAHLDSMHQP